MDVEQEISAILAGAGFVPMPQGPLAGVFIKPNNAGGYVFGGVHVASGEVHAWDPGINTMTTNDPIEAALNLAAYVERRFGPPPESPSLGEDILAAEADAAEGEPHESNSETGEAFEAQGYAHAVGGDEPVFDSDHGGHESVVTDAPVDADFTETDALEALAEGADLPELDPPPPEDFAPEEMPEEPGPGAFIFGDNLAHDRIVRIGQLAEQANMLIDAAKLGYSESEHNAVRSHVVTNMNEAGAYAGGDQALFDRFIELERVTSRIRMIETFRDAQQDFIRTADREAVAAFDPEAGWP